jgi:mRNA-binding protein PUF3
LKTNSSDTNRPQGKLCGDHGRVSSDLTSIDLDLVSPGSSETKTGSSSLLPSSESESWSRPHNNQWPSANNISPGLVSARNGQTSTSPVRHRNSIQNGRSTSPFFSASHSSAIGQGIPNKSSLNASSFLDPTSGSFKASGMFDNYVSPTTMRHGSEDASRRPLDSLIFGSNDIGPSGQIGSGRSGSNASIGFSGQNSSAASRSGSLPPSRHGNDQQLSYSGDHSNYMQSVHFGTSDTFTHRPNQLSHASTQSAIGSKYAEHASSAHYNDLASTLSKMDISREVLESQGSYYDYAHQPGFGGNNSNYSNVTSGVRGASLSFEPETRTGSSYVSSLSPPYNSHRAQLGDRMSYSPGSSDLRRSHDSPVYSNGGTPPLMDHQRIPSTTSLRNNNGNNQAAMLERRLQELQQGQVLQGQLRYQPHQQNPVQYRPPFTHPFDYSPQSMLRMNPAAPYYAIPPLGNYQTNPQNFPMNNRAVSQPDPIESNHGESLRSTLLEEFRSNNKGTKRYELKVGTLEDTPWL